MKSRLPVILTHLRFRWGQCKGSGNMKTTRALGLETPSRPCLMIWALVSKALHSSTHTFLSFSPSAKLCRNRVLQCWRLGPRLLITQLPPILWESLAHRCTRAHLFGRPWFGSLGFLAPLLAWRCLPSSLLWGRGEDSFWLAFGPSLFGQQFGMDSGQDASTGDGHSF